MSTDCETCRAMLVLNTQTGEPRVAVSMTVAEMVEAASAVSTPSFAERLICAIGMLDDDAARAVADDRAEAGVDAIGDDDEKEDH